MRLKERIRRFKEKQAKAAREYQAYTNSKRDKDRATAIRIRKKQEARGRA